MREAPFTTATLSNHSFPSRCAPEASPTGEVSRLVVTEGAHKTNLASRESASLLAPTGASHHLPRRGGYGKRRRGLFLKRSPNDAVRRRRRTLPLARIQKPIFIGCASVSRCRGRRPRRPAPVFPRRSARSNARSAIHDGTAVKSFVPLTPRLRGIPPPQSEDRSFTDPARKQGRSWQKPRGTALFAHFAPQNGVGQSIQILKAHFVHNAFSLEIIEFVLHISRQKCIIETREDKARTCQNRSVSESVF